MTPRTITVSPLLGATLRLGASGGPVSWSITESAGLLGRLTVSPSSGRLQSGQSVTVTVSVSSAGTGLLGQVAAGGGAGACVGCQLTVNPGDIKVTVILAVSVGSTSPPPSSQNPDAVAARPLARLEN